MDIKMNTEEISTSGVSWDCVVKNGIVPVVTDEEEDLQCATLAGFLISGTVPQLPDAGVPWTEFLTGGINFGALDYYVRESLNNVEKETFYPEYSIDEDKLLMSIGKITQEETSEL